MDEEFEDDGPLSRRFRKEDLAVLALGFVHGIVSAFHETATVAYDLAAMHANYKVDQDAFHEEAALAIETITGEES